MHNLMSESALPVEYHYCAKVRSIENVCLPRVYPNPLFVAIVLYLIKLICFSATDCNSQELRVVLSLWEYLCRKFDYFGEALLVCIDGIFQRG